MVAIAVIKKIELSLCPPNELSGKCTMPEGASWLLVTRGHHLSCPFNRFAEQLGSGTFLGSWQHMTEKQGPWPFWAMWAGISPNKPEYQNPSDTADVCKVAHPLKLYLLIDHYEHIPRLIMWRIVETSKPGLPASITEPILLGTFVKKE